MVPTLLSVLLVSIPAATGNSKGSRRAGNVTRSSSRLPSFPASQALFIPNERQEWPPYTASPAVCGEQETNCAAQGHPEICCLANTACYSTSHKASPIFCCSLSFHACSANLPLFCPIHTFPCPASFLGACCPVGLRCASSLCLEYEYKTQAIFSPSLAIETKSPETFLCTLAATTIPAHTVPPPGNPISEATAPTCVPPNPNCQPGTPGKQVTDLPISDRILGTPTAWRAKVGEIAVESRARTDCDGRRGCWRRGDGWEGGKRCWRRAVWSGVGLFGIAGIMLVM